MMKTLTLPIILMAALTSGCVPSLCLFNCGSTTTTEQRTHRWDDNTTFMQDGTRWSCTVGSTSYEVKGRPTAMALCHEVKP